MFRFPDAFSIAEFDYASAAGYKRFEQVAKAIRFAIEGRYGNAELQVANQ